MTKLSLRNLGMEYESSVRAIDGLDLTVNAGELMVLVGPSGCGKTTALRLIAGLLHPTSGDVLFDDRSVLAVPAERRGAVMVFQDHALFPFKTVGENVAFGLKLRKVERSERRERVADALSAVQLSGFEHRWPDELSGGQRQRIALARTLVVRPRLLLLDEPLTSLEPGLRAELRDTICRLQRAAGITTVFVTHDQGEAMAVADRIAFLIDGRLRQVGPPSDFLHHPVDADAARFFGAQSILTGSRQRRPASQGRASVSRIH